MSICESCDDKADVCLSCERSNRAQSVRDWIDRERCKPAGLRPDEVALLERCAADLGVD